MRSICSIERKENGNEMSKVICNCVIQLFVS